MPVIGDVDVHDAYAFPTRNDAMVGSCYMTFTHLKIDERWVTGVGPVAGSPFADALPMTFGIDAQGTWSMLPLRPRNGRYFHVAPGSATVLRPGGAHIMLVGLTVPLTPGLDFDILVKFDDGASGIVEVHKLP